VRHELALGMTPPVRYKPTTYHPCPAIPNRDLKPSFQAFALGKQTCSPPSFRSFPIIETSDNLI